MTAADLPPLMPGGESTSAQLANALSAFTTAEELRLRAVAERDKAANTVGWLQAQNTVLLEHRDLLRAELASAQGELKQLRAALVVERATAAQLRADYAEAADELQERHGWIVARDGGRDCERCEQEVERGQAYEIQPGTGGLLAHIHCPTSKEKTMPATADDGNPAETLLNLPLPDNDANAATVRDYLVALLLVTWEDGPKRPFGNSGWHYDLYAPMVKAGLIPGELDADGYVENVDTRAADALVVEAIKALAPDRGAR